MTLAAIRRAFGPFDAGLRVVLALLIASPIVAPGFAPGRAAAQVLGLGPSNSDQPLEIYANEGIEWRQNEKSYIARGNARAVRGKFSVHADVLTARYRKVGRGKTEIWRIEAEGHVRIKSPTESAYADKAVYTALGGSPPRAVHPRSCHKVDPAPEVKSRDRERSPTQRDSCRRHRRSGSGCFPCPLRKPCSLSRP